MLAMAGRFKSKLPRQRHYIREWRESRKLNLDNLAQIIGMSAANLSRLENLKQDYSQGELETIAAALDCEPSDLIERDPNDKTMPYSFKQLRAIFRSANQTAR